MKRAVHGLILFSIIDILYTALGAFYGGGGAELNPLFSWIRNPIQFIIFITVIKAIVISALVIGILKLHEHEQEQKHDFKCAKYIGIGTTFLYGFMLFGILGLNVWFWYQR